MPLDQLHSAETFEPAAVVKRTRRPSAKKLTPEQMIKNRLKAKFNGAGWESREALRQELELDKGRQWTNVLMDSMVAGFTDFIVATRGTCTSFKDVFENWHVTSSKLGNTSATYGELFTMYCLEDAERNHMPSDTMVRMFRNSVTAANLFTSMYLEIIFFWNTYVTREVDTRDHETLMDKLKAFDSIFERKTNGFVATPFPLAREMIAKIPLNSQSNVIDLAVGRGTFLLVTQKKLGNGFGGRLFGIDKDASKAYITAALLEPYTDCAPTIFVGDALEMFTSEGNSVMPKFDAVVGNPPYNTPRNDAVKSADLYPDFIHLAAKLAPNVTMVTPSRWFAKNKNNSKTMLREKMVYEYGLREIVILDPKEVFDINLMGGLSYFVLDRGYIGETTFDGKSVDLKALYEKYGAIAVEHDDLVDRAMALITEHGGLLPYYHGQMTFNVMSNHQSVEDGIPCLFSRQNGWSKFVSPDGVKNLHLKDKWKVIFPEANGTISDDLQHIKKFVRCLAPGSIVSQSFIFFEFDTEAEQQAFFRYITSDAVLKLVAKCKITQHFSADTFRFVPNIRDASLLEQPLEKAA